MKIAVIDLGTNTFNLLIAKVEFGGKYKMLYNTKKAVKLGEGGINEGIIRDVPFLRGIAAMKEYKDYLDRERVEEVFAYATSAIRDARNGKDFCDVVHKETGIEVDIINGYEEAELIYKGVRLALDMGEQKSLIMDIGGGSNEFIIADKDQIYWKLSVDIGVARLMEKFKPSDPMKPAEIDALMEYMDEKLQPLKEEVMHHNIETLIGSSGSFDTFFELIAYKFHSPENIDKVNTYDFNLEEFYAIYEELLKSNKAERLEMEGMVEMRADMIVVAAICTMYILKRYGMKNMRLSRYSLKEGVLGEILK